MSILYSMCVPHPPLIIPEIGQGEEKTISNTIQSYKSIMKYVSTLPIETVIVISPHAIAYSDYIHISPGKHASGDFSQFHAGNVRIEVDYDTELVKKITQSAKKHQIFAGTLGKDDDLDHGTMIPLYFLNKYLKDYKVVRIGISGLSPLTHYRFGQCIKEAVGDKNVLLIASGDLSHCLKEDGPYGYTEEGPLFDHDIITAWKNSDFMRFLTFDPLFIEAASECGLRSFQIMAGALDQKKIKPKLFFL
ncbi:AmmeMemoRadiSam system protein B [Catenibacterium sp.]|uniref:AmmeMemoRadiSam system protein B n=1 Tax=Catenibacterium sp. TaxID=2049022 RepID=UPI00399C2979